MNVFALLTNYSRIALCATAIIVNWSLLIDNCLAARPQNLPPLSATVRHIIDGDTFSAIVKLQNEIEISVRVRFLGIDAPELTGECDREIEMAILSRDRLAELIPVGSTVTLMHVKDDKYLGRINADVKGTDGRDVGEIMIAEGHAVPYGGGARGGWCD